MYACEHIKMRPTVTDRSTANRHDVAHKTILKTQAMSFRFC